MIWRPDNFQTRFLDQFRPNFRHCDFDLWPWLFVFLVSVSMFHLYIDYQFNISYWLALESLFTLGMSRAAWLKKMICESILVCMSYLCLYNIFPMNNQLLYDHLYQNICIRVNDYFQPDVSPKFGQFDTIYFVANHDNSHLCGSNQCDLTWFLSVLNTSIKVILILDSSLVIISTNERAGLTSKWKPS